MKRKSARAAIFAFAVLVSSAGTSLVHAQQSVIAGDLVGGVAAGITTSLTGYAMTAIGLNTQSAYQTSVLTQLTDINNELDTISDQLTEIQDAIETETCDDQLSSTAVTDALASIETVSNEYQQLVQAGENTNGAVSQSDIDAFLSDVNDGPGGGLPSISAALSTINVALQGADNSGIIGTCEDAVTSIPATGSFGADADFYSDPINLLQYFADFQTVGALMQAEYWHYEAFLSSPYYSSTVITNGLSAADAAEVCNNATGNTLTDCGFARDALEEVYVYLQNQYTANGVPYSTEDSGGNLLTGLYFGDNGTNYLFATSIEDFTNSEDPEADCPSVMTESNGCGLTFSNDPLLSPFWSNLSTYEYETAWEPATPEMWRTILDAWATGDSSDTVADALTSLGFQNAAGKIVLTQTEYYADPKVSNSGGTLYPFPSNTDEAICYLDTNLDKSFSLQPFCYNGESDDVDYGDIGATIWLWGTWDNGNCMTFRTNSTVLDDTEDNSFYGEDYTYDSYVNIYGETEESGCPAGSWENDQAAGWVVQSGATETGYQTGDGFLWPAIDESSPACGTNYSYGLVQPALTRTSTNFLGIPTMCGSDFDAYFTGIEPRNPYLQVVFTNAAKSGPAGSDNTIGPMEIELQDVSSGTAVETTLSTDLTVNLTSTSSTGYFSATAAEDGIYKITSVTIPSGNPTIFFYYGDTTAGTPQITADPGNMVPAVQTETITSSDSPSAEDVSGTALYVGSNTPTGKVTLKGRFTVPDGIQLHRAQLTFWNLLSEDAGAGELVRQGSGIFARLPVTLVALDGSTARDAIYATAAGVTPQVRVEIAANQRNPTSGKFKIVMDSAKILSPSACVRAGAKAVLHTKMIANDGMNSPAVFDENLTWTCRRGGKLTTRGRL
ncbi:MAG: hypothetical protein ACREQI_12525 [Candidatus Binataceae bacterium]